MKRTIYISIGLLAVVFCATQTLKAQEDTKRLIQVLENDSDSFSHSFDNAMDNSTLNGTSTEGDATRYVKEFEDSIDHLKKEYDNGKDTSISAREVVARAKVINGVMRRYKFDAASQTDWRTVKGDLTRLATAHKFRLKW
jgi:hypothetical protein